ncbi:MAG: NAD(P)H-dependent glycerol-3-phosphate dehydrogenase [Candidatus Methylacidiphilales bacterium]
MHFNMIGGGAWGTAVATLLQRNEHQAAFLPKGSSQWDTCGDAVFLALPCQNIAQCIAALPAPACPVISLVKGIDVEHFLRVSELVQHYWPGVEFAVVSGPSFAHEVMAAQPTAAVVASTNEDLSCKVQTWMHQRSFRLYRSRDVVGVELGGALKNVYAIAGGMCCGLGMGENARAALMTRCLAEMTRIALEFGARAETLAGLSGAGDLMLTAYSGRSRNHQVGEALGAGKQLETIMHDLIGTAEGVPTTQAVYNYSLKQGIRAPVLMEVHAVLFEGKSPRESFRDLMTSRPGEE